MKEEHEHQGHSHETQECCCSHEHSHEGEREHEHHHEHGHSCNHNGCEIRITEHDQFKVASYSFVLDKKSKEECSASSQKFIAMVGKAVEASGGIIGHIKAIARFSSEGWMLSLTFGEDVTKRPIEESYLRIDGVAIVAGIEEEHLCEIISHCFDQVK